MATDYFTMMKDVAGSYGKGIGQYRDRQYEDEKRAREKVIQGREDKAYADAQSQLADVNTATQKYGLLSSTGKRNDAAVQANDADFDMAVQATGQGLQMPTAMPAQREWTPATDLDRNQGLQGIMRASRNWDGVHKLQKEEKGLRWDQTFGERLKSYTGSDEQAGQAAQYLNNTSKRVSMGTPDDKGIVRMSVVTPDGRADFLKLTKQDQAQLYAAAGMMEMDPQRALTIMSGVNKGLAEAIAADNDIEFKLGDAGSKAATQTELNRHNTATERIDNRRAQAAITLANRPLAANIREFKDATGKIVMLDISSLPRGTDGKIAIPAGLSPVKEKLPYTNKDVLDLAKELVGTPRAAGADGKPRVHTLDSAMVAAENRLGVPSRGSADGAPVVAAPERNPSAAKPGTSPNPDGERPPIQLLQPLYDFGAYRKKLQEESNSNPY